jgi:hypothetical protein
VYLTLFELRINWAKLLPDQPTQSLILTRHSTVLISDMGTFVVTNGIWTATGHAGFVGYDLAMVPSYSSIILTRVFWAFMTPTGRLFALSKCTSGCADLLALSNNIRGPQSHLGQVVQI